MNKIVVIDEDACIACGECVTICPNDILYIDQTKNVCKVMDETDCDKSRGCERVCPTDAIKIH